MSYPSQAGKKEYFPLNLTTQAFNRLEEARPCGRKEFDPLNQSNINLIHKHPCSYTQNNFLLCIWVPKAQSK